MVRCTLAPLGLEPLERWKDGTVGTLGGVGTIGTIDKMEPLIL